MLNKENVPSFCTQSLNYFIRFHLLHKWAVKPNVHFIRDLIPEFQDSTSNCLLHWSSCISKKPSNLCSNLYLSRLPSGKELACQWRRCGLDPWVRKSPGEGNGTPVFLPGKSHDQSSLAVYSSSGHKRIRHNLGTKQQLPHG